MILSTKRIGRRIVRAFAEEIVMVVDGLNEIIGA